MDKVEKLLADCEKEAADCVAAKVKASGTEGRALEEKNKVNAHCDALTKCRDDPKAELTARRLTDEAVDAALRS